MDVKEFDELINALPKVKIDEPISSMNSINIEDLRNAVERLKKIPTYQDLLKENQELKKQLEEVEFIVGLRQKRNLISKFDKEYDEEDKKKNPNRDYAGIMPDAEEIYRRYYTMKNQQKEFIEYLQNNIESLEFCDNEFILSNHKKEIKAYKEILSKYKEITGE